MLPGGTTGGSDSAHPQPPAPFPRCPPRCRAGTLTPRAAPEPRGRPGHGVAESTLASKRLQLGTGNRPVPTLGTYPAHHSSAKPIPWPWGCSNAGVPGLSPRCLAAAGMGGSVPVLVGEPRLSCPRACGSRRILPRGGNREDDPAQPPAGLALSHFCPVGAAGPAVERQGEQPGPAGAFPKKV